ncbi:MAG: MotA/TolQ/ExbB proton channel family protein [bacterium]
MSVFSILVRGGWLMIPIALCSFIAAGIVIERWLTLRKARVNIGTLMNRVRQALRGGEVGRAVDVCEETPGPVAGMLKMGIQRAGASRAVIRETVESAGKAELYKLERGLDTLATVAAVAPLLGFLGTVTGMIKAFMEIQALGGQVNANVLAGGIWEALMTTAAGLTVGIPAMIFYNWLVGRVQHFVFEMENSSMELLDLLADPGTRVSQETAVEA